MTTVASPRVAVVVAGAGARGAYEAGVLSVLVPHLREAGTPPDLYVGTSAGAINGVVLASTAHLPPADQAAALLDVWRRIQASDVFRPLLLTAPLAFSRGLGQLLRVPGARLTSLVDTAPLRRTAERALDWGRLRTNLDSGLTSLAVVTTSSRTGRTVVFVDRPGDATVPPSDEARPIDYVAARIDASHVLASAAIPVLFPAVEVQEPTGSAGWYVDGGVRLNAPLKPALALGAEALAVIATHPADYPASGGAGQLDPSEPDVDDALVQLLDAALVDRMVEDVHTLSTVNQLVVTGASDAASGHRYGVVPLLFFGPPTRDTIGMIAAAAFDEAHGGVGGALRSLLHPDVPLLGRLLAGDGPRRGDLLSYLLFDRTFVDRAIERGRLDATAALALAAPDAKATNPGGGLPWLLHPPGRGTPTPEGERTFAVWNATTPVRLTLAHIQAKKSEQDKRLRASPRDPAAVAAQRYWSAALVAARAQ